MESTWNEQIIAHYKSNTIHLDWLSKPSQHQFRWRTFEGRWVTSKRRIRNHETLMKAIGKNFPSDLYVSTSSWLNPIDLPRLRDTEASYPILIDHLIVFDIDVAPLSLKNLELSAETASPSFLSSPLRWASATTSETASTFPLLTEPSVR